MPTTRTLADLRADLAHRIESVDNESVLLQIEAYLDAATELTKRSVASWTRYWTTNPTNRCTL